MTKTDIATARWNAVTGAAVTVARVPRTRLA